jgi:hypothetical protein
MPQGVIVKLDGAAQRDMLADHEARKANRAATVGTRFAELGRTDGVYRIVLL